MDLDILEKASNDHIEWPYDEECQASNNGMSKICAVVVSHHLPIERDATDCSAARRRTTSTGCRDHVHGEVAVSNVSLQVGRLRIRVQRISVPKSVKHRLRCGLAVDPFPAIAAHSLQHEHRLVADRSSWQDLQIDRRRKCWFSSVVTQAWRYRDVVAIIIWIHDEHQAVLHHFSKTHAHPRVRRTAEVD